MTILLAFGLLAGLHCCWWLLLLLPLLLAAAAFRPVVWYSPVVSRLSRSCRLDDGVLGRGQGWCRAQETPCERGRSDVGEGFACAKLRSRWGRKPAVPRLAEQCDTAAVEELRRDMSEVVEAECAMRLIWCFGQTRICRLAPSSKLEIASSNRNLHPGLGASSRSGHYASGVVQMKN